MTIFLSFTDLRRISIGDSKIFGWTEKHSQLQTPCLVSYRCIRYNTWWWCFLWDFRQVVPFYHLHAKAAGLKCPTWEPPLLNCGTFILKQTNMNLSSINNMGFQGEPGSSQYRTLYIYINSCLPTLISNALLYCNVGDWGGTII